MRPQSIAELAALIDPTEARVIVAMAIIAAGADGPDWTSETIEHVLDPFLPVVNRLMRDNAIPDPFNSPDDEDEMIDALDYYRGLE